MPTSACRPPLALEKMGRPTAPSARYTPMLAAAQPGVSIAPAKNTPKTPRVRLTGPMTMLQGAITAVRAAHRLAKAMLRVLVCCILQISFDVTNLFGPR